MLTALRSRLLTLFLMVLVLISAAYLLGVSSVPFHPDESTQLFTSGDVGLFFQKPSSLFWDPAKESDVRQAYRELDAPLTHLVIAAGRWVTGQPALPVDWDWSKTWAENRQAGALPSAGLLLAGRLAVAVLFPFSILFFFLTVRRVTNDFTAWAAALLLASNALVLLHTRRAMAEGALLFTLTLTLWSLVKAEQRPWLVAIPAALAFCAKQSLAAFLPLGLLALFWQPASPPEQQDDSQRLAVAPNPPLPDAGRERTESSGNGSIIQKASLTALGRGQDPRIHFARTRVLLLSGLIYCFLAAGTVFLLNPFGWAQPVEAIQAAVAARQKLADAQAGDRPAQELNNPGLRLVGLIGSVYLTPPAFAEAGNYQDNTREAEAAYLANPLNSLFRSLPGGAVLLVLGLFGFALGCTRAARDGCPNRRGLALLLAATVIQSLALLVFIRLPWQRYYLPVVPFACLWAAYGLDQLRRLILKTH
jgi:hypothetical protein